MLCLAIRSRQSFVACVTFPFESIGDKGAVWVCSPKRGKEYEILVPLRTDLGDYIYRIADALHTLEVIEREHIQRVLMRAPTLDEAAKVLGIDASTLWRKRRKYEGE